MARWSAPGSMDLRETETSMVAGLSAGFHLVSIRFPAAVLRVMVSTQAVPVEERVRWFSRPAMRRSEAATLQSLPGVSCNCKVGPLKASKPQKPVMVPVIALVPASAAGEVFAVAEDFAASVSVESSGEATDAGRSLRSGTRA